MMPDLAWWGGLLGLLATQSALLLSAAALVAARLPAATTRRLVWRATLAGIALICLAELIGWRGRIESWRRPVANGRPRVVSLSPPVEQSPSVATRSVETIAPGGALPAPVWWPGGIWLAGAVALAGRGVLGQLWLGWRIRREPCAFGRPDLDTATRAKVERLRRQLGLKSARICHWPGLPGPVAFGVWRPTVALPAGFQMRFTPEQQAAVLAHEMAHLAARDPFWLGLAQVVTALFWWHPLVWWARRQLRRASEAAADDASAFVPGGRVALAESLVALGRNLAAPGATRGLAAAGQGPASELARRVQVLLDSTGAPIVASRSHRLALRMGVGLLTVGLIGLPWPGASGASLVSLVMRVAQAEAAVREPGTLEKSNIEPDPVASASKAAAIPADKVPLPPVTLAVHFVEIAEGGADDVGLDWLFGLSATDNPVSEVVAPSGDLPGAGVPGAENIKVEKLAITGQGATLSAVQFAALQRRLKERRGVDLLAAPSVTTLSGRQAQVGVQDMHSIVTGVTLTDGTITNSAQANYLVNSIGTGPLVEVLPTREVSGWKLSVLAQVNEFLGYDAPPPGSEPTAQNPGAEPLKATLPLPRFRVRKTTATADLQPGETLALRGPQVTNVIRFKDQVPFLGDLPGVGRLFRHESSQTVRNRLYVFVTIESADAIPVQGKALVPFGPAHGP